MGGKNKKIFGQDAAILVALWANVVSWVVRNFVPSYMPNLLPRCEQEDTTATITAASADGAITTDRRRTRCISIGRPGGIEQLRVITLKPGLATCGYNVQGQDIPFTKRLDDNTNIPDDCVVIHNDAFSVNYADCCIRWGLYASANEYVGYPIVPGFDVAGVVERCGSSSQFKTGDRVFGCSLFGSYSDRVLIPDLQLRKIPDGLTMAQAASLPTVCLTSLYALFLAGHYPTPNRFSNKAILIHSAAGGVGTMMVQMAKILGLHPIVGVVGRTSKVEAAKANGCDVVIDKQSTPDIWAAAREASPNGYSTIMESNGVSTLAQSYEHLAMTGRLIVYGFHSNLPMGSDMLNPLEWLRMSRRMTKMPHFDAMEMGMHNKGILAFNLSFFATERAFLSDLFDQVAEWLNDGKLQCPRVVEMDMNDIAAAHELIQSGKSIGKIILKT